QSEKEKLVSQVINLSGFGRGNRENPYKWLVLDVDTENSKALLIMDGYIDTMYMFADDEVHTWENSQVREYLNFQPNLDVMFTPREQEFILKTAVSNPANPKTGVSSGNDTTDRLFLLSTEEMEKYFENPQDRVVYDAEGSPVGQYLRTAGGEESYFAMIIQDNSGEIDYNGSYGYSGAYAIRPAMWVDVSDAQVPAQSPETDKPHPQNVQLGTLQIFDKSAITALRIESDNGGSLNDRQRATTGIYSIFEHDEWIQFYPVGDAEEIDIYYLAHDEKADYSKVEAEWVYKNGVFFTRLYNQKNESFPDGYWGASYFDQDMKTGYFDLVFTSGGKIVAAMTIQVFEEGELSSLTREELVQLNDGTASVNPQPTPARTPAATPRADKPQPSPTAKPADEKDNTPQVSVSDFVGTKTGRFYSVFTSGAIKMDYELVIDGQPTRMVTATKGDKAYMENYLNGEATGCSVIDGRDMYVIEHSSKLIIKMALQNDLMTVASKVITENDVDMTQLEKGSREIDGKKYDTESWVMDGDKVTMCFDGNKLAYIISDPGTGEAVIKILDYSADVDDSLFNIPSGYTVLDMSGN
ncbi:MAG: hypothetical protein II977_00245, partial [Oscillospiraceae bacterium]|nr:hypothetical protein [Oscillospiraceae bacterium]